VAIKTTPENALQYAEFEELLNKSFNCNAKVSELVKGTVIKIEKNGVLIDIGAKTEAIVPLRELSNLPFEQVEDVLNLGDEKEFYIIKEENEDGQVTLSLKKVSQARSWAQLETLKNSGKLVTAKILSSIKGGVLVKVFDLRGFIPSSQLRTGNSHDSIIGLEIEVKVLELDPQRNKLILSQRQAMAEERERIALEVIASLELEQIVEGEVVRIADFGVFVDINGIDGLLPISEMSWQRVRHPSDILSVGQKVTVKILNIDNDLNRISLSLKRMEENPWVKIETEFKEGQIIKGTVNKITSFGAFIGIYPGVEALLPAAEISDEMINPFNELTLGEEIEVLIKKFTPQEHRIGLSLKDLRKTAEAPQQEPVES
jgi:small subunit ribosomal protein S1